MKLLDPFAGYRLASGHPFFHIALFAGSWAKDYFGDSDFHSSGEIADAFYLLRWAHFVLFTLAAIEGFCNRPSEIPDVKPDSET